MRKFAAGSMMYVYCIIGAVLGTEMALHPAESLSGRVWRSSPTAFDKASIIMLGSLIVVVCLTVLGYKLAKAIKGFRRR